VEGDWAFGQPTGQGGPPGYPDPTSGYTGANVYGYNLNGNYTNNMPMYSLISTPFDCSQLTATRLKFRRWLNVQYPPNDWSGVWVSNDGASWTMFWQHIPTVVDNSWQYVEYDIPEVADGRSQVYLRWTMGPTNGSVVYSGWNIDDVEIWGIREVSGVDEGQYAGAVSTLVHLPNPFRPNAEIRYFLALAGETSLGVYDVAGRRVAALLGGPQAAGNHRIVWDGRDEAGLPVSAGIYFIRLDSADGAIDTRKATILR
jgi:hypothetical protein